MHQVQTLSERGMPMIVGWPSSDILLIGMPMGELPAPSGMKGMGVADALIAFPLEGAAYRATRSHPGGGE